MADQKQYTHSRDFKGHRVEINGTDISAIVAEFEIYQDIFSPYWTASMMVSDLQNELMQNEILAGDRVNITIEGNPQLTPAKHTFKFIIHQIGDRELVGQQHYVYQIQMVDEAFFKDAKERVSKAYDNKQAHLVVPELAAKIGGIDQFSKTIGLFSWIIPNLSPMASMEWMAKWAVSEYSGAADIFVFQQKDTAWTWMSLEEMFTKTGRKCKKMPKLVQRPAQLRGQEESPKSVPRDELEEYAYGIEQYKFVNHMNMIPTTMAGALANKTLAHNLLTRKASTNQFDYGDAGDGNKPYNNLQGLHNANINYQAVHPNAMGTGQGFEEDHQSWKGSRKSNMAKLDNNRLIARIPGRIDIFDQLGHWTMVELPSQQDKTNVLLDEQYKLRYLITAQRHIFTQKSYDTILELGKKRLA